MPNTINFPLTVYVQIGFIETEVITCAVIDTGSEITLIKNFLWNKWKKLDKSLTIKGVTGKSSIEQYEQNMLIIIGSKIVTIKNVYAYDQLEIDVLLGNDFIQQFAQYNQTLYMITLKTPCGHLLRIPREFNKFKTVKHR